MRWLRTRPQWERWFAWHPVWCCDIQKNVWWEWVYREVLVGDLGWCYSYQVAPER